MRRAAFAFGSLTVLAGAIFACESDPNGGGGPQFELDGSAPAFDAGQQPFDSGTPATDAGPDAPSGPPSVTVTVTGQNGPVANVRVVFHDAAGAVLESKVTDANGKAKSTGALPAMASALLVNGSSHDIVTWTGLENGDDLAVRAPDPEASYGHFNVTLPGPFDNTGLQTYSAYASDCYGSVDGTTTNATIDLYSWCVGPKTSSVLAMAIGENHEIVGHSFKKGNAVPTDGGTTPLTTSAWAAPTNVNITATNLPEQGPVNVNLLEIADGFGYADGFNHSFENGSATFKTATGFADALQATVSWYTFNGSSFAIAKRIAPGPTIAFDAAQALPAIQSGTITDGPDAQRPVIQWTSQSTAAADGGLVHVRFWDSNESTYTWTFVVPPGSTSVTAPAMPPEASEFLPDVNAGRNWDHPVIDFVEADVLPSYKEFRAKQGAIVPAGESLFSSSGFPTNGTYRLTSWSEPAL